MTWTADPWIIPIRRPRGTPVSAFDPLTVAWVGGVSANGGTVSVARQTVVNTLIVGLRNNNLLSKLDRVWLFAAENTTSALTDLIVNGLATAVASPTFTANQGYTFNGTSNYLTSGYNPVANGVAYSLNSAHMSVYSRTVSALVGGTAQSGGDDATGFIRVGSNSTAIAGRANDSPGITYGASLAGMYLITRTAATARNLYLFLSDGAHSNPDTTASIQVPNVQLYIGAENVNGTVSNFEDLQIAATTIGGGLTQNDATNLSNLINGYMTSLGVNVY